MFHKIHIVKIPDIPEFVDFKVVNYTGLKEEYQHVRLQNASDGTPRGAYTVCELKDETGAVIAVGYAVCSPKDNFNKAYGRNLALRRALRAIKSGNKNPIKPRISMRDNAALTAVSLITGYKSVLNVEV